MTDLSIENAVRLSHCANANAGHKCQGSCTICPDGSIELDCPLCGIGAEHPAEGIPEFRKYATVAQAVCRGLGLDWEAFSADAQIRAVREVGKVV